MQRNIIIILLSFILLILLTLKSSKLEFDYEYPNLKVSTNTGFIVSSNVITFLTDEYQLDISADGYESLVFDGNHSDGVSRIKLNKLPIKLITRDQVEMLKTHNIVFKKYSYKHFKRSGQRSTL